MVSSSACQCVIATVLGSHPASADTVGYGTRLPVPYEKSRSTNVPYVLLKKSFVYSLIIRNFNMLFCSPGEMVIFLCDDACNSEQCTVHMSSLICEQYTSCHAQFYTYRHSVIFFPHCIRTPLNYYQRIPPKTLCRP